MNLKHILERFCRNVTFMVQSEMLHEPKLHAEPYLIRLPSQSDDKSCSVSEINVSSKPPEGVQSLWDLVLVKVSGTIYMILIFMTTFISFIHSFSTCFTVLYTFSWTFSSSPACNFSVLLLPPFHSLICILSCWLSFPSSPVHTFSFTGFLPAASCSHHS